MTRLKPELIERFSSAAHDLDGFILNAGPRISDGNTACELRDWLDKDATPLKWAMPHPKVTHDEWFFITTLYGQMTVDQQRVHIRKFFPTLFVDAAQRDIRGFLPDLTDYSGLRADWMRIRLCKMGAILRDRYTTMDEYVEGLRSLEAGATEADPTPALDAIIRDHQATGWKTLSVFVRDCVGGNCFPIDSRVERELVLHGLPVCERLLVRLSLAIGRNPREIARMFYEAGGKSLQRVNDNVATAMKTALLARAKEPQGLRVNDNVATAMKTAAQVLSERASEVIHFLDDDEAYFTWLDRNASGLVVNCNRKPRPPYLVLHRATCGHIRRHETHTMTCGDYRKVCATREMDMHDWAKSLGGVLRSCGHCHHMNRA